MHTVPTRSFTPMLLGLLLLAQLTPCAARAQGNLGAGRADLSVTLRNGWVDVLVANRGPGDLPEHFRLSRAQIGAELKFLFFRDGRRCVTCRFKAEFDHVDAVARSSGNGPILASEAVGFGVFEAELACTGFSRGATHSSPSSMRAEVRAEGASSRTWRACA